MSNPRTTWTAILAALSSALTILAALPAQLGDLSTIIPENQKHWIIITGLIATTVLKVLNGMFQQDSSKAQPTASLGPVFPQQPK